MTGLYELTEQYADLQRMCYDPDAGSQVLRDTMEAVWGEIEDKADGYARIIMEMKADMEALRAEERRMAARRRMLEKRMQGLKEDLENSMRAAGKLKFRTAAFNFSIQLNGGLDRLVIDAPLSRIPEEYLIPQPPKPDNEAIRALLAKEKVKWAHLEPQKERLRIS